MLTAIMIAMFYLGAAAGVMGAALMGTFASTDARRTQELEDDLTEIDLLRPAA